MRVMDKQFKKIFFVLFAILLGAGIIFFAWRGGQISYTDKPSDEINSNWADALKVIPQTYPQKTLGVSSWKNGDANTGATTTTSILARDLMINYAIAQKSMSTTTMSDSDAELFAQNLLENTTAKNPVKQYSIKDLHVVETSTTTVETYQKETLQAINSFSLGNTFNELVVVAQALDTKSASKLAPLSSSVTRYENLVDTLISIQVPRSATTLHIGIIQGYATVLSGIKDMQRILADPAQGLQGIAKYKSGVELLTQIK